MHISSSSPRACAETKFVSGEQWDEQLKQDRINAKRPVLTFNRLPTFVQQVANEARQNKAQTGKRTPGQL